MSLDLILIASALRAHLRYAVLDGYLLESSNLRAMPAAIDSEAKGRFLVWLRRFAHYALFLGPVPGLYAAHQKEAKIRREAQ